MAPIEVNLSAYKNADFERGASVLKEAMWLIVSLLLFQLIPIKAFALKRRVLSFFGAKVGKGVVIKPNVRITFPWKLTLGDDVWLGEECWLLNLAPITIESNVCVSQRAFLCTGNHDYSARTFDLIVKSIYVEQGAWIAAGAFVGPNIRIGTHAVLTAHSVAVKDLEPYGIYQGNPAKLIRQRSMAAKTKG
jgi:putative colanic acid biosynthesis acetyltransferase WcaF